MERFRLERSGDEPMHARSPLRLRLVLAGFGLVTAAAGIVVFAVSGSVLFIVIFAVIAVSAVVDIAVVVRHIRQGSAFQPGPGTPPYRPDRSAQMHSPDVTSAGRRSRQ